MKKIFKCIKRKWLEKKIKYYEKLSKLHSDKMFGYMGLYFESKDKEEVKRLKELIDIENSYMTSYRTLRIVCETKLKRLEKN